MILFFGPPGSGKSSQGRHMVEREGWLWLSTGELFRQSDDKEVHRRLASGELIDDELTSKVVCAALSRLPSGDKVILDGYPRNLEQVEWLGSHIGQYHITIDGLILFELPRDEIIRRLTNRGRAEDTADVIGHRLDIYEEQTVPVVGQYRKQGVPIMAVDATGTIDEVHGRIRSAIGQCLAR